MLVGPKRETQLGPALGCAQPCSQPAAMGFTLLVGGETEHAGHPSALEEAALQQC